MDERHRIADAGSGRLWVRRRRRPDPRLPRRAQDNTRVRLTFHFRSGATVTYHVTRVGKHGDRHDILTTAPAVSGAGRARGGCPTAATTGPPPDLVLSRTGERQVGRRRTVGHLGAVTVMAQAVPLRV
ncbi:hypothetical protein JCM4814A_89170 [Streptomyces phaeofaciens JCM 4814]|uniref:Endoglucanase B carbohydrate binding domain-containing protein n=1 Tax=Streptomyces phaeofaciens TaxID=68254 RepID=A0A918HNH6_9ACTN|nr:hypothetical protein [Streptomyces phaeofaciens]GGT79766.1 hypothetical protein GCM10010226_67630 [Streptomyces phaeofaciens]